MRAFPPAQECCFPWVHWSWTIVKETISVEIFLWWTFSPSLFLAIAMWLFCHFARQFWLIFWTNREGSSCTEEDYESITTGSHCFLEKYEESRFVQEKISRKKLFAPSNFWNQWLLALPWEIVFTKASVLRIRRSASSFPAGSWSVHKEVCDRGLSPVEQWGISALISLRDLMRQGTPVQLFLWSPVQKFRAKNIRPSQCRNSFSCEAWIWQKDHEQLLMPSSWRRTQRTLLWYAAHTSSWKGIRIPQRQRTFFFTKTRTSCCYVMKLKIPVEGLFFHCASWNKWHFIFVERFPIRRTYRQKTLEMTAIECSDENH